MRNNKNNRHDNYSDYDDVSRTKNDIRRDMDRRKEKHMNNVLRSKNFELLMDEEEDFD